MTDHRILVIGDSYMTAEVFTRAFTQRGIDADVATMTITEPTWDTSAIREFEGDPAEVARIGEGYDIIAFHAAPVTADVLAALPDLRLVGCARGGPVNVDLDAARERGVRVTTTPGKNADAVADLTIGFLISLVRNVPASLRDVDTRVADGRPLAESTFEGARWFGREVRGLRLGLIGYGNVARLVAARARALGATITAYDPFVDPASVTDATVVADLDALLSSSDVVSVHARATAENRHMIGAEQIARMPEGSFLINTARESLVDEQALLDALRTGHLAGVALDVNEPDGPWRELVAEPNLILTPHLAGATHETLARGADMLASEIEAFIAGGSAAMGALTDVFLAIDAGTGSARALAFDVEGRLVTHAAREWTHVAVPGHPGGTVFDTDGGWTAIAGAVSEVVARLDGRRVAAVAASSMREGFVLSDAEGREVWACPNTDGRARTEAAELVAEGVADEVYRTAGDWVSITAPARLRWIARHEPEVLARARHFGMLSDWVTTRLTGEFVTEATSGSSSALFDLRARNWSDELAGLVGIDRGILPPVVACGDVVGHVTSDASAATGLPIGTPVVAGGADTQLALHGIAAREGRPTIVAGTFWQTTAVTAEPLIDPERRLRTLCHVDPGTWMVEGIGFLSGLAMRWFRDAMCPDVAELGRAAGTSAFTVMEQWASEVPAGANGIVATMANVMQADAWHHAAPAFVGFDINDAARSSRGAFIRAIEESAAIVASAHLDILSSLTDGRAVAEGTVTFTGGSSAGALWPKVIAGVTGLDTRVTPAPEATSYGAARLAAAGVGAALPPMGDAQRVERVDPREHEQYRAVTERWHRVYRDMVSISHDDLSPLFTPPGAARGPLDPHPTRLSPVGHAG